MAEHLNITTLTPIKVCTHRKSGKKYYILGEVINTTNSKDGQVMVHYTDGNESFVRESGEFYMKFHGVRNINTTKDYEGFAHCHPRMQALHHIDQDHVIIDRRDWAIIRNKLKNKT